MFLACKRLTGLMLSVSGGSAIFSCLDVTVGCVGMGELADNLVAASQPDGESQYFRIETGVPLISATIGD